jgi:hypothetical protein
VPEPARDHALHFVDQLVVVVGGPAAAGVDRHARAVAAEQPVQRHAQDLPLEVPERDVHRAQRAEGQALASDTAQVVEQLVPERIGLEGIAPDQTGRDVMPDQLARRLATDLVIGDADALESLVRGHAQDQQPDGFDLARGIGEVSGNRRGDEMDVEFGDPMTRHVELPLSGPRARRTA